MTPSITTLTIDQYKALQKKKPKYGNRKVVVDGIEFDSQKEAKRYRELALMVKAGQISELQRQQTFPLAVNGKKVCDYKADFTYIDKANRLVVEDVKGYRTQIYRLKAKLFEAVYGYKITEV